MTEGESRQDRLTMAWEQEGDLLERLREGWPLPSVSHELSNLKQICFPGLGIGLIAPSVWMHMG